MDLNLIAQKFKVFKMSAHFDANFLFRRSIMEKILLECMYDIPDKDTVDKVVLNKDAVVANKPIIVYKEKLKIKKKVGEN